jgi:spectinomycin phosphotransferase
MEPALNLDALAAAVEDEYGCPVQELTFIPTGWVSACYALRATDGRRAFLRLCDDRRTDITTASDPRFYLPLMAQLRSRGILPNLPQPLPTRHGQFSTRFGGYQLLLLEYIDGQLAGYGRFDDAILGELARLVGILHRSIGQLEIEHPLVERFDLPFERDLLDALRALDRISTRDRAGLRALRELLLGHRDEVECLLARLHALQARMRADRRPKVVCHTDLHGENLMLAADGTLYILDWEGAMIAPPEQDLFFFVGDERFWSLFLPAYEREAGPTQLEPDAFGFYIYRRNLEDVAGFVLRILRYNTTDGEDAPDLNWLAECLADWPRLEAQVEEVTARLADYRAQRP